jgi:histidinol-phosphate aminotransferase
MATRVGARPVPVALDDGRVDAGATLAAITPRTRALVICNPNDPTGTYVESPAIAELLSLLPEHVYVLLDESLVHFQDREPEDACLQLVQEFPKLIVFRSFSNAYALSGLRAGYAVGSTEMAPLLESIAPVLGVNAVTQSAVESVLGQGDGDLRRRRELVISERQRLESALASLPVDCPASQAHFVWLRVKGLSSNELAAALKRGGVIVLPGSALGDPDHVRVSLMNTAGINRLLSLLSELSTSANGHSAIVENGAVRNRAAYAVGADLQASAA